MKLEEAIKIQNAFSGLLEKMRTGDVVDVPEGRLLKAYKGIAISVQDYDTLCPFLFADVERKFTVGGVSSELGSKICISATITEKEVFLNLHPPGSIEYYGAYMNLSQMATSFLAGTSYKRIPIDEIYKWVDSDEGMGGNSIPNLTRG